MGCGSSSPEPPLPMQTYQRPHAQGFPSQGGHPSYPMHGQGQGVQQAYPQQYPAQYAQTCPQFSSGPGVVAGTPVQGVTGTQGQEQQKPVQYIQSGNVMQAQQPAYGYPQSPQHPSSYAQPPYQGIPQAYQHAGPYQHQQVPPHMPHQGYQPQGQGKGGNMMMAGVAGLAAGAAGGYLMSSALHSGNADPSGGEVQVDNFDAGGDMDMDMGGDFGDF